MSQSPYITFTHRGSLFGVEAAAAREIVHLPELAPIEEAPAHVAGVFNLRGRIVPAINLDIRFGHATRPPRITDKVVILSSGGSVAGVIVDEALDIWEMAPPVADPARRPGDSGFHPHFVRGETEHDGKIVMILDHATLIQSAEEGEAGRPEETPAAERLFIFEGVAEGEMAVFRERAAKLSRQEEEARDVTMAVTVARLGGELFGFDASVVREITHAREMARIPCCPPHIIGAINLRGGLITVVDIRGALGLGMDGQPPEKVAVVDAGGVVAGVAVEEAVDVLWMGREDISPPPSAVHGAADGYVTGIVSTKDGAVTLVDVVGIFAGGVLTVDEEV